MVFLFAGNYVPDYNRTLIIESGLKKLGHTVIHFSFKKKNAETREQLLKLGAQADVVFLPSFTQREVSFVRKALPTKKLAYDPLISHYMTRIFDYKLTYPWNPASLLSFFRDLFPHRAADLIFTDTLEHRAYFHRLFRTSLKKMEVLYIGNNFDDFYPPKIAKGDIVKDKFRVGFYGGFIPLQGVSVILEAAKLIGEKYRNENIEFELIGSGFEFERAQAFARENRLHNVQFSGWIPYSDLRPRLWDFDIALGIFGSGIKANHVIPNKIYHYAACGLAVITKDTAAIREVFTENENIVLTDGTPEMLVNKILQLKHDFSLRSRLGQNAFQVINSDYNEVKIAESFVRAINSHLLERRDENLPTNL